MPFYPQDYKESTIKEYLVKVKNCYLCPFSEELLDPGQDFYGCNCTISGCYKYLKDGNNKTPEGCPLKKTNLIIKVELEK